MNNVVRSLIIYPISRILSTTLVLESLLYEISGTNTPSNVIIGIKISTGVIEK